MTMAVLWMVLYPLLRVGWLLLSDRQGILRGETVPWSKSELTWSRSHQNILLPKPSPFQHLLSLIMSDPNDGPHTAPMVLDEMIDNDERISTKVVEKTFDIKVQLPSESRILATTPYTGPNGAGSEVFLADLKSLTLYAARMILQTKDALSHEQILHYGNVGISSSKWVEILTGVVRNDDCILVLSTPETIQFKVIMSRLAHTPPNALFSVVRSSTDPSNASRAWSAAHLALGSWHAKVKRAAMKEAQKAAKNKIQTTLKADANSQMTLQLQKKSTPSLVSPDPKARPGNPSLAGAKRQATEAPSPDLPVTVQPKSIQKVAKDYVQGNIQESRISFKFLIPEKKDTSADVVALNMIADLLQAYQAQDPTVAILPWKITDAETLYPIADHSVVRTMESSKFRLSYADRFRPKTKQNCWFSLAIAHTDPNQHLISGNSSNLASWFDDHDCGAWLCTVQGADDTVPVGELLYGGPFLDVVRVKDQLEKACKKVFPNQEPVRFGCRISKNLDVPMDDGKPRNWMLAENQLIRVEAARGDARKVKHVLYQTINKITDFRKRPGSYNIRYLPDKSQIMSGTKGLTTRVNTLRKHAAVVQSLAIIKSADIKQLDTELNINGTPTSLRSLILSFTFPLCPSSDEPTRTLFHSVDYPSSGPDMGKGVVYFTAYHDQSDIGERLVAILPAYIHSQVWEQAAKEWFYPGALKSLGEVTFGFDDDGNWDGSWSTAEDDLAQDILDEDMGIKFDFENLPDIETQMTLLTTDEASVDTFGTALGAKANTQTQQKESGIPAVARAVATESGDGPAV
jgi:hypothetical protein